MSSKPGLCGENLSGEKQTNKQIQQQKNLAWVVAQLVERSPTEFDPQHCLNWVWRQTTVVRALWRWKLEKSLKEQVQGQPELR